MLRVERKSLFQFVFLFIAMNVVFLMSLSTMYYFYQKSIFTDIRQKSIIYYVNKVSEKLFYSKSLVDIQVNIIRDPRFDLVLINKKNKIIFPTDKHTKLLIIEGFSEQQNSFVYIEPIEIARLPNIHLIAIKTKNIDEELAKTKQSIYFFLFFSFVFISIMAVVLSRLFLRPMREYIGKLDRFIRDTTHELNTPLSVISMSIERISEHNLDDNNQKQLKRISIASKTISNLYNDLTFLIQYQNFHDTIENIDLSILINERICYFKQLAESKKITIEESLVPKMLDIDKTKFTRVIDNLLSNAIKYNKRNGTITIILTNDELIVSDTGIGIPQNKIKEIFNLYTRFDDANGGFGIGLNLVKLICEQYKMTIVVSSEVGHGTTFKILF